MALTLPTFPAGHVPTAPEYQQIVDAFTQTYGLFVQKNVDEIVNNSTTLQNDDELTLAVTSNATYEMVGIFRYTTNTTANIKFVFAFPTGLTTKHVEHLIPPGLTVWQDFAVIQTDVMAASGNGSFIRVEGIVSTGNTPGNLTVQWAQNTANVSNTTVQAGSYLRLQLRS